MPSRDTRAKRSVTGGFRRIFCVWCALVAVSCARAQHSAPGPTSILEATGDSIHLTLLDAATARPIASTDVELFSDNGIRCIKAPCPTDGKSWKGTSDSHGTLVIPKSALNKTATLKSGAYYGDVIRDASPAADGGWTIKLLATDPPAQS